MKTYMLFSAKHPKYLSEQKISRTDVADEIETRIVR